MTGHSELDTLEITLFNPWEGDLYRTEGLDGVRLLIIGEALYANDIAEPMRPAPGEADATKNIVIDLAINGPKPHRPFWTKVTKLLLNRANGEPVSKNERIDTWNRVAFYNYLQWWMPAGRTKPTPAMWTKSREPFIEVVRTLNPDAILVLGLRLQENLPQFAPISVCVPHPSSHVFNYTAACSALQGGLNRVRTGPGNSDPR